ncbi:hypothetical protein CEXT_429651, partial [Caerostris extrusa]
EGEKGEKVNSYQHQLSFSLASCPFLSNYVLELQSPESLETGDPCQKRIRLTFGEPRILITIRDPKPMGTVIKGIE